MLTPECPEHLLSYADHIGSTSSLLKFATEGVGGEFIVLTEPGIIHQMKKANPTGKFYDCPGINQSGCVLCNTCPYMQLNNLEKLYKTMKNRSNEITLSKNLIKKSVDIFGEDARNVLRFLQHSQIIEWE